MNTRIIPTLREILENLNIIEEILNETSLGTISFSFFHFFIFIFSIPQHELSDVPKLLN